MKTLIQSCIVYLYSTMTAITAFADSGGEKHHKGFDSGDVIVTLGVLTLISLISTFLAGYFMAKNRKLLFPWHKRIAISTVVLAATHALMVLIFD